MINKIYAFVIMSLLLSTRFAFGQEFLECAQNGELDKIKNFVEKVGVDVNLKDRAGNTALFYAAASSNLEVASYLLEKGAQLNITNKKGETPLHLAIDAGASNAVQLFLNHHANFKTTLGKKTYLQIALERGDAVTFRILRDYNLSLSASSRLRITSSGKDIKTLMFLGNLEKIKNLVKAGRLINEGDIELAILLNDTTIIHYFNETGFLDSTQIFSYFSHAFGAHSFDAAHCLLNLKGGINTPLGEQHDSFLGYALKGNSEDMVTWLLDNGADVVQESHFGQWNELYSPFQWAVEIRNYRIAAHMLDKGVNSETAIPLVLRNFIENEEDESRTILLDKLMERPGALNQVFQIPTDPNGYIRYTAIGRAISYSIDSPSITFPVGIDLLKRMLIKTTDINSDSAVMENVVGKPLELALTYKSNSFNGTRIPVLRCLLEKGADPLATFIFEGNSYTPLSYCEQYAGRGWYYDSVITLMKQKIAK